MGDLLDNFELNIYHYFHNIGLCTSTILLLFTATIIVKAPNKNMGVYQWYLLNEVLGSYVWDLGLMVLQPVAILPNQCLFALGFLRYHDYDATRLTLKFMACSAVWKVMGLYIALFYRYLKSLPPNTNCLQTFLGFKKWTNICLLFAVYCCITFVIVFSLSIADIPQIDIKYEVAKETPMFQEIIVNEPSTLCFTFYSSPHGGGLVPFYLTAATTLIFVLISLLFFGCATYYNISEMQTTTSFKNQRLHSMLLFAWLAQLMCMLSCGAAPLIIGLVVFFVLPPNTNHIFVVLFSIISLHSIVDCIILLMVVKPYRVFIRQVFFGNLVEHSSVTNPKLIQSKSLVAVKAGIHE